MSALKAVIEEATGVPAARQRLICRGRVLKDTQRLAELRVEDGDTLHMVWRWGRAEGGEGKKSIPLNGR